ncbi:hypothetical protein Sm713_13230 [Streptomyces sp. TS71-3]|nr:hypothetical protein Sm713_13230 [Streptomyces sp. TS71-3]
MRKIAPRWTTGPPATPLGTRPVLAARTRVLPGIPEPVDGPVGMGPDT